MAELKRPALDPATVPVQIGTSYPEPFRAPVVRRQFQRLGEAVGLKSFGVNLVRLAPGVASSQRHWHTHEDEFVYVLEGEVVLVTDGGEQTLGPGLAAGFPGGVPDGHHFINRSQADVVLLVVGDRRPEDAGRYPDIDLAVSKADGKFRYTRKDGTPY
jgi:uncharacterized cupin superfamily protein